MEREEQIALGAGLGVAAVVVGCVLFVKHEPSNPVADAQALAAAGKFAEVRELLLPVVGDHASVEALSLLATSEVQLERWPDAAKHALQSVQLDPATGDYTDLTIALYGQGNKAGGDDALKHGLVVYAAHPVDGAAMRMALALYFHKHHDEKTALDHAQKGAVLAEQALGPTDATTMTYQLAVAKIALADGQREVALPLASKLVPELEAMKASPLELGDAQFALARALPDDQRKQARDYAFSAQSLLQRGGADGAQIEAVMKWLASHQ